MELDTLAAQTAGFTGADLANLVNEAALLAARRHKRVIEMEELEEAVLRVIAGPEKKSRILSEEEKLITAYHETGHALVAHYLPNADPVHKISIISRGQALGYTITLPTEDKFMVKKKEIIDKLSHMLAGRVAEEIRFDDITTGASNDLQRATETARRMITQYGMSENLGPLTFGHDPAQPFVGRDYGMGQEYSDETAEKIDAEIRRVVDEAYDMASKLLTEHRDELDKISLLLIDKETIDREEFEALLAGEDPEEVFKARDEARARKAAESKRVQRQRRAARAGRARARRPRAGGDGRGHADDVARAKTRLRALRGQGQDRAGRPPASGGHRRGSDIARAWSTPRAGWPTCTRRSSPPSRKTSPRSSRPSGLTPIRRWSWSATSPSTPSASII